MSSAYPFKSLQALIINRCNYRCTMCDIWKGRKTVDLLEVADLQHLVGEQFEFFSINGGEPTLHPRFHEIVEFVHDKIKPGMLLVCSNGSQPHYLEHVAWKYNDIAISVSFDGMKSHNQVRGVPRALRNVLDCVRFLRPYKCRKILSYTCMDINKREIRESFEYAMHEGWEFDFRLVDQNDLYGKSPLTMDEELYNDLRWLIENESDKAKKLFYQGYFEKPAFVCQAGKRFAYLLPDKKFYACLSQTEPIGTLETGLVRTLDCNCGCWVDCYFYDNFHEQLENLSCMDTNHKRGGERNGATFD